MNKSIRVVFLCSLYAQSIVGAEEPKSLVYLEVQAITNVSEGTQIEVQATTNVPEGAQNNYHSYLRDICGCIAPRCNAATTLCSNECRFVGESCGCQSDGYNDVCYVNYWFLPCDRMDAIICRYRLEPHDDVYCGFHDRRGYVALCCCIPLLFGVAPIALPIAACRDRWCKKS